jgi:hypothetical protein
MQVLYLRLSHDLNVVYFLVYVIEYMSSINKSRSTRITKLSDDDIKVIIDNYDTLSKHATGEFKDIAESVYYYFMWSDYVLSEEGLIKPGFRFVSDIFPFGNQISYTPIPSESKLVKLFNEFMKAQKAENDGSKNYDKQHDLYYALGKLDMSDKYHALEDGFKSIKSPNETEKKINELAKEYHGLRNAQNKLFKKRIELQEKFEKKVLEIFNDEKQRHILPVFSKNKNKTTTNS